MSSPARAPPGGFTFSIVEGSFANVIGFEPGDRFPAVADGQWIFLAPLPAGQHVIRFQSTTDNPDFQLDVTYHLTVGGEDGDDDD